MKFVKLLIIKPYVFLWLTLLFLCLGLFFGRQVIFEKSPAAKAAQFQIDLNHRYQSLQKESRNFIKRSFIRESFSESQVFNQIADWDHQSFIFLVYKNDSLIYWSDNSTAFPIKKDKTFKNREIIKTSNGWYQLYQETVLPHFEVVSLARIKNDYPYENDYLKNDFYDSFSATYHDKIAWTPPGFPVKGIAGNTILYYRPVGTNNLDENLVLPVLWCFILAFLMFFLFLYYLFGNLSIYHQHKWLFFIAFTGDVILFRGLTFWFKFPGILYKSELFSPSYFAASSWLPSLGDLFTNSILLFFIAILWFRKLWSVKSFRSQSLKIQLGFSLTILPIIAFYCCYIYTFNIIVSNTSFPLTLSDPSTFTLPLILTLIIITLFTAAYFLLIMPVFKILSQNIHHGLLLSAIMIFALMVNTLFLIYNGFSVFIPLSVFVVHALWSIYLLKKKRNVFSFPVVLAQIILYAFLTTYMILSLDEVKEWGQRKLIAQKLASERDPLAEFLIKEAYGKMQKDSVLITLLEKYPEVESNEKKAIQYISDKYFSNYWSRYNLEITLCTPDRILNVVIPDNTLINCSEYFNRLVKIIGKPTISSHLYFLDYGSGSINYLAMLPFKMKIAGRPAEITVYIDITSKRVPKGLGYPELLISKDSKINPDINNYSYAVYKNNELVRSYGKYSYPLINGSHFNRNYHSSYSQSIVNKHSHLVYPADDNKLIIVSLKKSNLLTNIAPFSYFSILLSIVAAFILLVLAPARSFNLKNQTFRNRLQLSIILIILFSFVIIGVTSGYYIIRLNQTKNTDALTEKAHSILGEIQQSLGKSESLTPEMSNEIFYLLNKLSLIFFSDINLYNLQGSLIASSRPLIFEEGLLSTKMNSQSYAELTINKKSLFIHEDQIGNYRYLSAYLPFRNEQDKLIGYLNLPYFARQDEIRSELSTFMVAFTNIYLILIAFSIIVAIIVSRYITRPMLLIRDKISQVKLGKPNEKIEWNVKDEIGGLIEEYNAMIDKLAYSADQLARSERESAWREMARQVAHEIKNPLTPMKLSVQLLLKAYQENEPGWDQRLKRFSQTLIEQIDNLAHISSSFSDFARMPELQKESLNLIEICNSVIELHAKNPDVDILSEFPQDIVPIIQADKNQINRILVNLFKNSLQALDENKKGIIRITITQLQGHYLLSFCDNGRGIEDHLKHRIFTPNFTTKTGGTGLGLAMIKSIMEDHGGSITFESQAGIGTTFFLSFPIPGGEK